MRCGNQMKNKEKMFHVEKYTSVNEMVVFLAESLVTQ